MIYIDFQPGAHGHFLEFVCNKYLAKVETLGTPFNKLGASHDKQYITPKQFYADHFFIGMGVLPVTGRVVSVQISEDDLLPLASISLLRAGDLGLANDVLEVDTYHKLNNRCYQHVLDNIINRYSVNQIQESYNAVRDPSWPEVNSLEDFQNLPEWIRTECLQEHNLHLLEISDQHPDCPRWVLREFFKLGFKFPSNSGFMKQRELMQYGPDYDVFYFPYACFYDLEWFKKELQDLAKWAGYDYEDPTELHEEFLKRQPHYKDKIVCDNILERIYNKESFELPELDLMKESYLAAQLELHYDCEFPVYQPVWFKHSDEILEAVQ